MNLTKGLSEVHLKVTTMDLRDERDTKHPRIVNEFSFKAMTVNVFRLIS